MDNYNLLLELLNSKYKQNKYYIKNINNNEISFYYDTNGSNGFISHHTFNLNDFKFCGGSSTLIDDLNKDCRLKILKRKLKLKSLNNG